MSNYMPGGASIAFDFMCEEEQRCKNEKLFIEREIHDAYEDAVSKFYDSNVTLSVAESLARIWAERFYEGDYEDKDAMNVFKGLDLDWRDCYAILGKTEELTKLIKESRKFWDSADMCDYL